MAQHSLTHTRTLPGQHQTAPLCSVSLPPFPRQAPCLCPSVSLRIPRDQLPKGMRQTSRSSRSTQPRSSSQRELPKIPERPLTCSRPLWRRLLRSWRRSTPLSCTSSPSLPGPSPSLTSIGFCHRHCIKWGRLRTQKHLESRHGSQEGHRTQTIGTERRGRIAQTLQSSRGVRGVRDASCVLTAVSSFLRRRPPRLPRFLLPSVPGIASKQELQTVSQSAWKWHAPCFPEAASLLVLVSGLSYFHPVCISLPTPFPSDFPFPPS